MRVDVVGQRPDYRELTDAPRLLISTVETNQRDWFDLGVIVTIKGREIPFNPLFKALAKGHKKLLLVDGSYLSLDQPELERLHHLIEEAQALQEWDTGLRISRYQASLWADFEDLADETVQAQTWRAAVAGLLDLTAVGPTPLPAGVRATLRPYQLDGFAWLAFLWRHRLGGILADDMGLGKTLQTLALIVHAIEERDTPRDTERPNVGIPHRERPDTAPSRSDRPHADLPTAERDRSGIDDDRPFLVVAPTSVVSNWLSEARRFAPGLDVRAITTTQAKGGAVTDAAAGADVIVTSYALFRLDFDAYQAAGWAGLILDEAQFVKNRTARVHLCAKELNAPFKLALTGTPMENNLLELWSLFSIVAPGLFPSAHRFTEEYVRPVERGENPELLARLRRRIRPLMMRRTKELVARDLPPKQEQVLRIELAREHRDLYEPFLQRERQKLFRLLRDDLNQEPVHRVPLADPAAHAEPGRVAHRREVRGHPVQQTRRPVRAARGRVVAEGHRALIFSQFTSYLAKVASRLDAAGIGYAYLDGSTRNRAEVIAAFKDGSAPVFLISLKAGGFGLNLTEADYVFLLDPWWNPATLRRRPWTAHTASARTRT